MHPKIRTALLLVLSYAFAGFLVRYSGEEPELKVEGDGR